MAFIPAPNTAMVEILYTQDNQMLENTLYFEGVAPWTELTLTQLATAINGWWVDEMQALTSNTVTLRGTKATSLESETAPSVEVPPAVTTTGSSAEQPLPNNVTIAIKFGSASRGRSGRGRNYIVGLTENVVAGNQLDAAVADLYLAAYGALSDITVPNDAQQVIVSRFTDNAPRVTALTSPVTSRTFADLIVDSQRRRLPGRGT